MQNDNLFNPSDNNPKGYTITSWSSDYDVKNKNNLNHSDFDCPLFWKERDKSSYIEYFTDPISIGVFNENKTGFSRSWGGEAIREGCWIHNRIFDTPDQAIDHLNLKEEWGNIANQITLVEIKAGARYLKGGTKDGKGEQLYIHSEDVKNKLVVFHQDYKNLTLSFY